MRLTVTKLREILAKEEARWTDQDREVMGEFGDLTVCILSEAGVANASSAELDLCVGFLIIKETK